MDASKQKNILIAAIALVVLFIAYGFFAYNKSRRAAPVAPPSQNTKPSVAVMEEQKKKTEEILKTDPTDPVHVSNLKYIQSALERYFNDKRQYPKTLGELVPAYLRVLPKYSSNQDYFYAHYPKEKPQFYHLGTLLGGRNSSDAEAFKSDTDFNSAKAGYENGFNGLDPVYDLAGGKK